MRPSLTAAPARAARVRALLLVLAAYFCFACLDASAKYLAAALAPLQIVWMRFVTHSAYAALAIGPRRLPELIRARSWPAQALRALMLMGATVFNFLALRHLQLAEANAIFFLTPFIVTALAGPFLGEWAGPRRWAAICVGFVGALVVLQPGTANWQPAMLLSLAAAASYSFYLLLTRKMTDGESAQSMVFLPAAMAALLTAVPGLLAWRAVPGALDLLLLLATGLFGWAGHLTLIRAHETADAPTLAPFLYTELIWMVLFGYVVFGDVPGLHTMVGAGIVVASGLYLLYRERRVRTAPAGGAAERRPGRRAP